MLSIWQFLARRNIIILEQFLYSPDLALCDIVLYPKLKGIIKETYFEGMKAIKRAVMIELRGIPEESF